VFSDLNQEEGVLHMDKYKHLSLEERDIAKLLQQLHAQNYVVKHVFADDYAGFREVIPETYLTQSKRYTTAIEQSNSDVRHWLARFRRRGKVVSKSTEMVTQSLTLLAYFQANNNIENLIQHVFANAAF